MNGPIQQIKQSIIGPDYVAGGVGLGAIYTRSQDIAHALSGYGFHYSAAYIIARLLGGRGLMLANFANISFECAQKFHLIPGSYDARDIVAGAIGALISQLWARKK